MRNPKLFVELSPGAMAQLAAAKQGPVRFITDISLRDLAAIAAMQGLLTDSVALTNFGVLAFDAVQAADALLAELEKKRS